MFSWSIGRISYGLKTEFELAMVNEPSVFELLRFDCSYDKWFCIKSWQKFANLFLLCKAPSKKQFSERCRKLSTLLLWQIYSYITIRAGLNLIRYMYLVFYIWEPQLPLRQCFNLGTNIKSAGWSPNWMHTCQTCKFISIIPLIVLGDWIHDRFSAIFPKGNSFYDFLFAFQHAKPLFENESIHR